MITLKINVMAIDKAKLFNAQSGAVYLDCIMIETPNNEYNDYMIVQSVSKEEREAGVKGAILGNAKVYKPKGETVAQAAPQQPKSDDLPF